MMITKSQVESRKAQLITDRDKLAMNISAYSGAIEDCDFWLEVLASKEDKGE